MYIQCYCFSRGFPRDWFLSHLTQSSDRNGHTLEAWKLLMTKLSWEACVNSSSRETSVWEAYTRGSKRLYAPKKRNQKILLIGNLHAQRQRRHIYREGVGAPKVSSPADWWRSFSVWSQFIKTERGSCYKAYDKTGKHGPKKQNQSLEIDTKGM